MMPDDPIGVVGIGLKGGEPRDNLETHMSMQKTFGTIGNTDLSTKAGEASQTECYDRVFDQDHRAGALTNRDMVPREDRDLRRVFTKDERAVAYDEAPTIPGSAGSRMDLTGRNVSIEPGSTNADTDHILAHSMGGKTSQDNARILERQANQSRGNKPLSDVHDKLFRPDYLDKVGSNT